MYRVYSVRDCNVGFNQPFVDRNDDCAVRGFAYAVNNSDLMGFRPNDFDLYQIGEFDEELGKLTALDLPILVIHGTEVFANG